MNSYGMPIDRVCAREHIARGNALRGAGLAYAQFMNRIALGLPGPAPFIAFARRHDFNPDTHPLPQP